MVNINISEYSPQELSSLVNRIKKEQASRQSKARRSLRAKFRKEAEAAGMKLQDVFPELKKAPVPKAKKKTAPRVKKPIRFRNRTTGETWTGAGRTPRWVTSVMRQRNVDLQTFKSLPEFKA